MTCTYTPFPVGVMPANVKLYEGGPPFGRLALDIDVIPVDGSVVLDRDSGESFRITTGVDCGAGCKCAAEASWVGAPDGVEARPEVGGNKLALAALIDAGLTFGEAVTVFAERQQDPHGYVDIARDWHAKDGEVEIDSNAILSEADDSDAVGAYVMAWVWIESPEAEGMDEPHRCDRCTAVYDEATGDGYCGLCPSCADKTEPHDASDEQWDRLAADPNSGVKWNLEDAEANANDSTGVSGYEL